MLKIPDPQKKFDQISSILARITFINFLKLKIMSTTEELAKAYSGIFGEQVVVKKGGKGKSVIAMARARVKGVLTDKQIAARERLSKAAQYARRALEDPGLCELYTKRSAKGLPAFRVASNDFLQIPKINEVDLSGYNGNPGDAIVVTAFDKIGLTAVNVKLSVSDGTLIEEGPCEMELPSGKYVYKTTCQADVAAGVTVFITVRDIPGNVVGKTCTL